MNTTLHDLEVPDILVHMRTSRIERRWGASRIFTTQRLNN